MADYCRLVDPDRFWARVETAGPDDCWLWQGARTKRGYGTFTVNRAPAYAHRIAWALSNKANPGDLHVLHDCDNPPCANPKHLHLGTHTDNMREMRERHPTWAPPKILYGEESPNSVLTASGVYLIRYLRREGATYAVLGRWFGVDWSTIRDIVKRNRWKHLPPEPTPHEAMCSF